MGYTNHENVICLDWDNSNSSLYIIVNGNYIHGIVPNWESPS